MKKILLLFLVFVVPYVTTAQKRSKKGTDTKIESKMKSSDKKSNFMIIKGVEVDMTSEGGDLTEEESNDVSFQNLMKKHIKPVSRFYFSYDIGGFSEESQKLTEDSKNFRSMVQAVNRASEFGWEFINSTIVIDGSIKIHYYYMKR